MVNIPMAVVVTVRVCLRERFILLFGMNDINFIS